MSISGEGAGRWARFGLCLSAFSGYIFPPLPFRNGTSIGIIVDDTVHFLSKYLRARREQGLDSADAVRYAFTTVGTALVVTSVVLVAGFSVLAFSAFELNQSLGLLTAISITAALVADFTLLPALLIVLSRDKPPEETNHVQDVAAETAN